MNDSILQIREGYKLKVVFEQGHDKIKKKFFKIYGYDQKEEMDKDIAVYKEAGWTVAHTTEIKL